MNAQQRLVSRDHIDFGRVWSAACCAWLGSGPSDRPFPPSVTPSRAELFSHARCRTPESPDARRRHTSLHPSVW